MLADGRLLDVKVLRDGGRFDAAAYMCGYVLEFGLKACVCNRLRVPDYPERELKGTFKTHNFEDLLLLAGLRDEITAHKTPELYANWQVISGWTPDWRYRLIGSIDGPGLQQMLQALEDPAHGVLPWLHLHW